MEQRERLGSLIAHVRATHGGQTRLVTVHSPTAAPVRTMDRMEFTDGTDTLMTLEAAAAALGVSLSTVRRWAACGRLRTHWLLSRRVIARADLAVLLAETRRAGR